MIQEPIKQKRIVSDEKIHPYCVVCSRNNPRGLQLKFTRMDGNSVEGTFFCNAMLEGYPGRLHGGVIASVLDGAMTHCLFEHGFSAVTVELNVRYRHPVETNKVAHVRGWIVRMAPMIYYLKSEVVQGNKVRASAEGKFMDLPSEKNEEVKNAHV